MATAISFKAAFDTQTFMKALVAGLVLRNRGSIRPQSPTDKRGFAKIVEVLDNKINELEASGSERELVRELVRIANNLRSSNTGGYEGFETALRGLQLTFASCPNPFYEEIAFSVPRPYAESILDALPSEQRALVGQIADVFAKEAQG